MLPVWTDIKVLMSIKWTSEEFRDYEPEGIFQNVLYTFKLDPTAA